MSSKTQTDSNSGRTIVGLDSIRFLCAMWVYFSHFGFVPLLGLVPTGRLAHIVMGLYNNLFCGVAAVIVFFVISGFCIHYPYSRSSGIPLLSFYLRRYLRILPPLAVGIALGSVLGLNMGAFYQAILWSLIAELVYYTIYPLLHAALFHRPVWLIVGSYVPCIALTASRPQALNYHEYGPYLTWIVGLPVWLLGCHLANLVRQPFRTRSTTPWAWRIGLWAYSMGASILRFHAGIGYPWTLIPFGLMVFFWLREEIAYYCSHSPVLVLESAGKCTYSLYLVHGLAVFVLIALKVPLKQAQLFWIVQTSFMLVASVGFYALVERPSHELARRVGKRFRDANLPRNADHKLGPLDLAPKS